MSINYFHSDIHGPICVASSTVPGNADDYKPDATGHYTVLAGIFAWGPTIAPVSLDWAAKHRQAGTVHGPA